MEVARDARFYGGGVFRGIALEAPEVEGGSDSSLEFFRSEVRWGKILSAKPRRLWIEQSHFAVTLLEELDPGSVWIDHSVFKEVDFTRVNFRLGQIGLSTFSRVNFREVNLSKARFVRCEFFDCQFAECDFQDTTFKQCFFRDCTTPGSRPETSWTIDCQGELK